MMMWIQTGASMPQSFTYKQHARYGIHFKFFDWQGHGVNSGTVIWFRMPPPSRSGGRSGCGVGWPLRAFGGLETNGRTTFHPDRFSVQAWAAI